MSSNRPKKRPKIVATAQVGKPQTLSEEHTIVASFHDFESLPRKKGDSTFSPEMLCHGHLWKIQLYPGGCDQSQGRISSVCVFLWHVGDDCEVKANFVMRIGSLTKRSKKRMFRHPSRNWGWKDLVPRKEVLDLDEGYLRENGTLNIHMDIQVWADTPTVWTPPNRLHHDMLESLESAEEGDACFAVGDKKFVVYKSWIARRAPTLGDMAASEPSGTDIPIDDVDPAIFEMILRFIYTGEHPESMGEPRAILKAADRFGCSRLKLIAEAEIVKAGIDADNAAELLLFADAHSCALLREATLEFCRAHPVAAKESEGWELLKESPVLLNELIGASPTQFSESDYDTMRVATLRQKLEEKDLEVDGTRETLIRRLKDASAEN